MVTDRIQRLKNDGDWQAAQKSAENLVSSTLEDFQMDPETVGNYAYALEVLADLQRDRCQQQEASEVYSKIIDLLKESKEFCDVKGRAYANIAIINEDIGLFDEAKESYKWALHYFEATEPQESLEVAAILNNLAFLYESENRFDEAEALFLKALKIYNDEYGSEHQFTANVWNNLGGLHYKNRKLTKALEMHKMALDTRIRVLGDTDIDTAQSYGNLAIVHAEMEDLDDATACFNAALNILENSPQADLSSYATVNSNYVHILKKQGHEQEAELVEKRISKFLKNH